MTFNTCNFLLCCFFGFFPLKKSPTFFYSYVVLFVIVGLFVVIINTT